MGETISTLVFRPPKPTPIDPNDYFHLTVDVTSPLYFPKRSTGLNSKVCTISEGSCTGPGISGMMCGEDSDLISLDRGFLDQDAMCVSDNIPEVGCRPATIINESVSPTELGTVAGGAGIKYKVPAFFVRRRGAKHTLLFSHGNAEDLGMMYRRMKDLALVLCVNVMAYDYTGYGLSCVETEDERDWNDFVEVDKNSSSKKGGKDKDNKGLNRSLNVPSENMIYRNIEAAYVYLTETRGIPPRNIILYGRSLGSGPSCYLAAKSALMGESVGGLILHSPFLSVYKVVADVGVDVRGDMFNNEKRAGNVRCPTLIIHGKEDEVVPFWHAPRLLAAIPPEFRAHPFYADGLGHNHIESRERDKYIQVITEFLMKYVPPVDENDTEANPSVLDRLMHWGESKKSTSAFSQYESPTPKEQQYANVIPEQERASPDEAKRNDSTFYINQTWIRHAKVICQEVFSDSIICNSAMNVVDWSNGSSRDISGSQTSNESEEKRRKRSSSRQRNSCSKHTCADDDARDDVDEFAPWTMDEGRQEQTPGGRVRMRRTRSDEPKRDSASGEMNQQWTQKKLTSKSKTSSKSTSMPVTPGSGADGGSGMKLKMNSGSSRKKTSGRSLLGFRR